MADSPAEIDDLASYFASATPEELRVIQGILEKGDMSSIEALKNATYRIQPPSPREFIQNWISPGIRDTLYPYIIENFEQIWEYEKRYEQIALYGGSRTGKSYLSRLSILYIVVLTFCMRDPKRYMGVGEMSAMAIFFMCFNKKKASQNLLTPFYKLLTSSPKFHQVKYLDKMQSEQEKIGDKKIVWSTASTDEAEISFSHEVYIHLGSNPMDIVGADIIAGLITEINFFIESTGITEDDVWRVYTDLKDRIQATAGGRFGSLIILDSSANNRESIIESYITEEAPKDPKTFYRNWPRWEVRPEYFPRWMDSGETFKVFKGTGGRAPAIVDQSFVSYPGDDSMMIDVPIDALNAFKLNLIKSLKDIAGVPQGFNNPFFPDHLVVENCFDPYLENVTSPIVTPLHEPPHGLIMQWVRPILFNQDMQGRWVLKRAKGAPRWVAVDLSESSDRTGMAMVHPEIGDDGAIYVVADYAFDVAPGKDGIHFDAILSFVRELYLEYHVNVVGISTDKHQSSFIKQGVEKDEKDYWLIQVDKSKLPYQVMKSKMSNGTFKVGHNSNLRNNFKSLVEYKDRIDHTVNPKAKTKGREGDKAIGIHAKDISDACTSATSFLLNRVGNYAVTDNYNDITRKLSIKKGLMSGIAITQFDKDSAKADLLGAIRGDSMVGLGRPKQS